MSAPLPESFPSIDTGLGFSSLQAATLISSFVANRLKVCRKRTDQGNPGANRSVSKLPKAMSVTTRYLAGFLFIKKSQSFQVWLSKLLRHKRDPLILKKADFAVSCANFARYAWAPTASVPWCVVRFFPDYIGAGNICPL